MGDDAVTDKQLRIYRIQPGRLNDFVTAWRDGVLPLRRKFGFEVEAWTVPEDDIFVWLVAYRGAGSFAEADAAYYASPERAALIPDPAHWIVDSQTSWLEPVSGGAVSGGDTAPSAR